MTGPMTRWPLAPSTGFPTQTLQPTRDPTEQLVRLAPFTAQQTTKQTAQLVLPGLVLRRTARVCGLAAVVRRRGSRRDILPAWVRPGRRGGILSCVYVEPGLAPIMIPTQSDIRKQRGFGQEDVRRVVL